MLGRILPILLAIVLIVLPSTPAFATTEGVPGMYPFAVMLSVANAALTVTNTVVWARDGSIVTGSLGVAIGALTIPFVLGSEEELDSTDKALLAGAAAAGMITGIGALLHGMHTRDASQSRIEVEPMLGVDDRKPTLGLLLIARW